MSTTESTALGNVIAMLDSYRSELLKAGQGDQALALKGLEIHNMEDAELALLTLRSMPDEPREAASVKRYIIRMLEDALPAKSRAA
jgi:hypothetical protein